MKVQLEKARIQKQKVRDLKQHIRLMRTNEGQLIDLVADLRRKLNPVKVSAEV